MKRLLYFTLAAALLFTSCQSTEQVQEASDSYQSEEETDGEIIKNQQKNTKSNKKFSLFGSEEKYLYGKTNS